MAALLLKALVWQLWSVLVIGQGDPLDHGTWYHSEPFANAAVINITHVTKDPSLLAPGYYFIAPYSDNRVWSAQVFDQAGELVLYGWPIARYPAVSGVLCFRPCDYLGESGKHLCWNERTPWAGGFGRVFNQSYFQVGPDRKGVGDRFKGKNIDAHELNMLPGGRSFLHQINYRRDMDLRPWGGPRDGIIYDACFQEVDVASEDDLFTWCYLDHLDIDETYIYMSVVSNTHNLTSNVAGTGKTGRPWDFLHPNAVDKNSEGDYFFSARHLDQVIKIAGVNNVQGKKPGETVWRLGGKHSDFEIAQDAIFSRQHHVRVLNTTSTVETISLFNNAWEGVNTPTSDTSSALFIDVHNDTRRAVLRNKFEHPENKLSKAQGSVELLANGNVVVGWRDNIEYSEFSWDGTLLYHAKVSQGLTNYRTAKAEWIGLPTTKPQLVAYCQGCTFGGDSPLVAYVSWNGATKVKSWRFSLSESDERGPWIDAGTVPRTGFETRAILTSRIATRFVKFASHVRVEALDEEGILLETSVVKTFVPRARIAVEMNCTAECCNTPHFAYAPMHSRSRQCVSVPFAQFLRLIVALSLLAAYENLDKTLQSVARKLAGTTVASSKPKRRSKVKR